MSQLGARQIGRTLDGKSLGFENDATLSSHIKAGL